MILIVMVIIIIIMLDLTRGGQDDEDPELLGYTEELLALTAQEGGEQQNYRGSFEDDLGDIHDWQNDVLTQRYLCRLLYLHYKQTVREGEELLGVASLPWLKSYVLQGYIGIFKTTP